MAVAADGNGCTDHHVVNEQIPGQLLAPGVGVGKDVPHDDLVGDDDDHNPYGDSQDRFLDLLQDI
jgi:hypothetical protein